MSSSRKRSEFIERIRYPNPLPLPPYPPKLLSIPTPFQRFTDPRNFGPRLAQSHPLPVVVDAEAGMPLNLTDFPQAWYTDQELEADDQVFPSLDRNEVEVDPEDAFLLSDILEKLPGTSNGIDRKEGGPGVSGVVDTNHITWLRRTEYLAAEQQKRKRNENLDAANEVIDFSREGQLKRIKESFDVANQPIESIRHPNKTGIRAVESFTLLPDPETWATQYNVYRFGDHPGQMEDNKPIPDPRLETAILRPHADLVDQPILSLFMIHAPELPQEEEAADDGNRDSQELDDDEAPKKKKNNKINMQTAEERKAIEDSESVRYKQNRLEGEKADAEEQDVIEMPFDTEESEQLPTQLGHIRDYEAHDESNRKDQELIFTYFDESARSENEELGGGTLPAVSQFEKKFRSTMQSETNGSTPHESSEKVLYYHPVTTRAALRVRRRRANDPLPPGHWDSIALQKRSLSMYEKVERLHQRAIVDDMDMTRVPERIELPAEEVVEEHEEEAVNKANENIPADASDDDDDQIAASTKRKEREISELSQTKREKGTIDDDDDEDQNERTDIRKRANTIKSDDEDGEDEDENGKQNDSDDEGEGEGDSALGSDEEMDDDELAALKAEAGADAGDDEEEEAGGRRRSRRAAASAPSADQENRQPREPLLMDVDEED